MMISLSSLASDLPKELLVRSDVGEIVLTAEQCKVPSPDAFLYRAYATEGLIEHEGCWYRSENIVNVYYPELNAIATYKAEIFGPRKK